MRHERPHRSEQRLRLRTSHQEGMAGLPAKLGAKLRQCGLDCKQSRISAAQQAQRRKPLVGLFSEIGILSLGGAGSRKRYLMYCFPGEYLAVLCLRLAADECLDVPLADLLPCVR